ncbi:MAG TPA: tetratricopeptide repeat protein [Paludibacter sp.]|nr:tetratricopeptide repeat protein [Paludibacter sp.]
MKKLILLTVCLASQAVAFAQLNVDRILTIGQNALYFEDYVLSIQYFNQAIKIKPYLAEPYMYRASAKLQLGDFQSAEEDCTKAIEINPFLPRAYYLRGFARKEMELYKEASNDFTKALEFTPNDSIYLMSRIESNSKANQLTQAINDIDLYLRYYPKKHYLLHYKGYCLLELQDTLQAENTFNKLIELDRNSYLGWSGRGLIYMLKKEYDKALKDYDNSIKLKSTYAGDYVNRGNINNDKQNYKQALIDYGNAIKYDSTEYLAYYNRGLLRSFLGDKNNALQDFNKVLKIDPAKTEAYLQKALTEESLGDYKSSIRDFEEVLKVYPYYIPAYEEISAMESKLGNEKLAFIYAQKAKNIYIDKKYNQKQKEKLAANNQMVSKAQKSTWKTKRDLFHQIALQNHPDSTNLYDENNSYKGLVQDKFTNLTNENDFVLSFITSKYQLRRTNLYHPKILEFNRKALIPVTLGISNIELPLTPELADVYFTAISKTSDSISKNKEKADFYFYRALEFTAVKDYIGALEDIRKSIELQPDNILSIFAKANIENKLINNKNWQEREPVEVQDPALSNFNLKKIDLSTYKFTCDAVMDEYDKVIKLCPDFSFAYYNKANILCTTRDFASAIQNYTKAIEIDSDFAEAYFNRGLTYLFIGEEAKGLADLSKAGELGIYKAYNLIQRFKK